MPKKLASDLPDRLEAEIRRHPEGVLATSLYRMFAPEASPRSLLRILDRLVKRNRILAKGGSRATRYVVTPSIQATASNQEADDTLRAKGEVYVPMTGEAPTLRDWVRRPLFIWLRLALASCALSTTTRWTAAIFSDKSCIPKRALAWPKWTRPRRPCRH